MMTKTRRTANTCLARLALTIAVAFALSACSLNLPAEPTAETAAEPRIGITIVATSNAPAPPTAAPAELPTSEPTPEAAVATAPPAAPSQCPAPSQSPIAPGQPAAFADAVPALVAYLNAGASVSASIELLKSWGYILNLPNSADMLGTVQHARLMPGDDQQMVAVLYSPADKETVSRHGDAVVLKCEAGAVQVAYHALDDAALGSDVFNPRVLATGDVTGDGLGDLSLLLGDCGASTCFDGVYILSLVNGAFTNVIPNFEWVPFPTFNYTPAAGGTAQDLQVHAGFMGSVGAGPQRAVTDTWAFDGTVFTRTASVKEPPVYRIHALQDGDAAFRHKDFAAAEALYRRVINDPSLQSWEGNAPLRNEPQVLAAFAYVRLMEVAAAQDDMASLQAAFDNLNTAAPQDSPGEIYAQLGEAFYNAYNASKDHAKACEATVKFAEKNQNTYAVIGQDTFGYANMDYQATDMCIVP
jgi:hypothetical protein